MGLVSDTINRLLERANAEGRTATRCGFCDRQVTRVECSCDMPWVDEYGLATCPARAYERYLGQSLGGHKPAAAP